VGLVGCSQFRGGGGYKGGTKGGVGLFLAKGQGVPLLSARVKENVDTLKRRRLRML
jgi:hypothetical protein